MAKSKTRLEVMCEQLGPGWDTDTATAMAGALAFAEAFKEWCARDFKSSENIPEKFALAAAQELMHEFIQHMSQPGKEGDE